jgi:predicted house-cleaning NTP pyrophosphatase (Maf/HAM1 superfamily)
MRKKQSADEVLILDDTLSEKPYTDENAINRWNFSRKASTCQRHSPAFVFSSLW